MWQARPQGLRPAVSKTALHVHVIVVGIPVIAVLLYCGRVCVGLHAGWQAADSRGEGSSPVRVTSCPEPSRRGRPPGVTCALRGGAAVALAWALRLLGAGAGAGAMAE
eukprot:CAMPEP_0202912232 /NCGR_PEP_ID=MMETSP1392-20130828/57155_1 /ASSEMBLY_ACC=CAM_ASM_000868 /TAXON_ID=225041 /ORGANISM="Chlamydomonas chlamydogama, Strain SAG 11-48b" /LENGTH=107 /DNA_ID=CAMNT_0049603061 /DNA_START=340 /DNA_END=662 /DNA_ORIENTATION=+